MAVVGEAVRPLAPPSRASRQTQVGNNDKNKHNLKLKLKPYDNLLESTVAYIFNRAVPLHHALSRRMSEPS